MVYTLTIAHAVRDSVLLLYHWGCFNAAIGLHIRRDRSVIANKFIILYNDVVQAPVSSGAIIINVDMWTAGDGLTKLRKTVRIFCTTNQWFNKENEPIDQ